MAKETSHVPAPCSFPELCRLGRHMGEQAPGDQKWLSPILLGFDKPREARSSHQNDPKLIEIIRNPFEILLATLSARASQGWLRAKVAMCSEV